MWVIPLHAQLSKWITFKAALPLPQLRMCMSDVLTSPNITPVFMDWQTKTQTKRQSSGGKQGYPPPNFSVLSPPTKLELTTLLVKKMNSSSSDSYPLVSCFMSSGWAPHFLSNYFFLLPSLFSFTVSTWSACICVLWLCIYLSCAHVCLLLISVSGKKDARLFMRTVDALHLSYSSSCPLSLISPSILLCSHSEYTLFLSWFRFKRNGNH